jgi:NADPH2:quinone reductase
MTWAAAALVEPLSCVVHGLRRLAIAPGSELLIVGAGTIGLLLLQAARRSGAAFVAVVDIDPGRLALAERLGADTVAAAVDDLVAERGIGFEYAIEATGAPAAAVAALRGLARGGTLLVFGVNPATATVPLSPFRVYNDELTILGSMAVLHTFEPAVNLMTAGAIAADEMVTHTYPLDSFDVAVRAVRDRAGLKVQIS